MTECMSAGSAQQLFNLLGSLFKARQSDEETHSPCISPEQKVKSEVSKYIDEQRIDVEQDPLTWWRLRRELYPVLTYVCS